MERIMNNIEYSKIKEEFDTLNTINVSAYIENFRNRKDVPSLSESDYALFLHNNGYNVKQTEINILLFIAMRKQCSLFYNRFTPDKKKLDDLYERLCIFRPPELRIMNRRVYMIGANHKYPKKQDVIKILQVMTMILDINTYYEGLTNGCVIAVDLSEFRLEHFKSPECKKIWMQFIEYLEVAPINWKMLYFIVTNYKERHDELINYVMKHIQYKFPDKIFVCTDTDTQSRLFPDSYLPHTMFGTYKSTIQEMGRDLVNKILYNGEFFRKLDTHINYDYRTLPVAWNGN